MKPHPIYKVVRKGEYFVNLTSTYIKLLQNKFVNLCVFAIIAKILFILFYFQNCIFGFSL